MRSVLFATTWDPLALAAALTSIRAGWLLIDLARPGARAHPLENTVPAAFAEARLLGAPMAFTGFDGLADADRRQAHALVLGCLDDHPGPVALMGRQLPDTRLVSSGRRAVVATVPEPDQTERQALWKRCLPDTPSASDIAWRFRFGAHQIARAADAARHGTPLHLACRQQIRAEISALATEVPPLKDWESLVLPDESVAQLRSIVRYVTHRDRVFLEWDFASRAPYGQGVSALFAGPPGTGKTMSAALIAGALGMPMFRIDLAGVVSKYIGETEKNLDKVFRAAQRSHAILFFDEADALFGKRTEVKDAHDRHANVETSYLLQQMESFDGVTILATNLKKNVDAAFLRRIQIIVDFPMPAVSQRMKLWQRLIPPAMPRQGQLDFAFLASQFELAGGHVKNAVQHAALLAAEADTPLHFVHLLQGVRRELHKNGKVLHTADFGPYAHALAEADHAGAAR